jgi:NADH-quinone oxidoreductase subunit M
VAASFATASIILAAVYILWMYQRTMTGPVQPEVADMPDLRPRELWAVGPLIAVLIFFGVYPKPLLDVINPAVHDTLSQVHVTDPRPQHPSTVSANAASFRFGNRLILVSAGGAQTQKGNTP